MVKVFSVPGITFKGDGFYRNDSRSGTKSPTMAGSSANDDSSNGKEKSEVAKSDSSSSESSSRGAGQSRLGFFRRLAEMPEIGVIGGSGLYSLLDDAVEVPGDEAFGPPSGPLTIGSVDGIEVAFLPRHGPGHRYPAHKVNYRANLWALRQAGVRAIFGPSACGSLRPEMAPGDVVVCDQLVDRTSGRDDTYFDTVTNHVSLADPYCDDLRQALLGAARGRGHDRPRRRHHDSDLRAALFHPGRVPVVPGQRMGCGWG